MPLIYDRIFLISFLDLILRLNLGIFIYCTAVQRKTNNV